ncbi:hypothetical protein HMPREF1359_02477 [Enterococcus faecium E417]|nr:hypothetical protein HMPREF1359_02477 [Enterococcus faecium E417]
MDQELFFVWLFLSLGAGQLFHDLSTKQYSNCCFSVISPTKRKIGGAIFVWRFL